MTWEEALDALKDHPHHKRYSELCADDSPLPWAVASYRTIVVGLATGVETPRSYPPLLKQAGNVFEAAKRLAATWWAGESVTVDKAEAARRMAICFECDKYDPNQGRCTLCGCWSKWKKRLATEHCPLPESEGGPKW
jgi:hypothetical protein